MRTNGNAIICDREEIIEFAQAARNGGRTIVFANGCFDLLHVGHLRYLTAASELADVLIVGVNSDAQARELKGEGRPYVNQNERAELIAGIRCVDAVTIFEEPTVTELLRAVRPNIHAKGTDYTEDTVPEREIVKEFGGRVAIVGDPKDHSSTAMFEGLNAS